MANKLGKIFFLIYLIFGLHFINFAFNFISLPEFILNSDKWITFVGGILILIGGINYLRARKKVSLNKFLQ